MHLSAHLPGGPGHLVHLLLRLDQQHRGRIVWNLELELTVYRQQQDHQSAHGGQQNRHGGFEGHHLAGDRPAPVPLEQPRLAGLVPEPGGEIRRDLRGRDLPYDLQGLLQQIEIPLAFLATFQMGFELPGAFGVQSSVHVAG
jgi:hypothetical protein